MSARRSLKYSSACSWKAPLILRMARFTAHSALSRSSRMSRCASRTSISSFSIIRCMSMMAVCSAEPSAPSVRPTFSLTSASWRSDDSRALRSRWSSASASSGASRRFGVRTRRRSTGQHRPMAMPGEAAIPTRMEVPAGVMSPRSRLPEPALDELRERPHGDLGVLAVGGHEDRRSLGRREGEDAHDALSVHLHPVLLDVDLGSEAVRDLDELRGGPGVQPERVHDEEVALVPRHALAAPVQSTDHRRRGGPEEGRGVGGGKEARAAGEVPVAEPRCDHGEHARGRPGERARGGARERRAARDEDRRRDTAERRARRAQPVRGDQQAEAGDLRDDRVALLVSGAEEPDAEREVDGVVDDEGNGDGGPAEEERTDRGERPEEGAERRPEEPVAHRRERPLQRLLVPQRLAARLRPGGHLLLVVDGPTEDRGGHVRMAVEELEVAAERLLARRRVRVESAQGGVDGVGEPEVLHAAPVPGRLQEQAPPEDAREGRSGHPRAHARNLPRATAATSVAPSAAKKSRGALRARSAFAPDAQASAANAKKPSRSGPAAPGTVSSSAGIASAATAAPTGASTAAIVKGRSSPYRFARTAAAPWWCASSASARCASRSFQASTSRSALRPTRARGAQMRIARMAISGEVPVPWARPASTAPPVIAAVPSASWTGSAAPRFTAPSQKSSSGAATSRPPCRSPSAQPASGASVIGRDSMACRKPLRSTAARPATRARTR